MSHDDVDTPENNSEKVPSGRFARLSRLSGLATRVAGGMLAEGARKLARGERPKLTDMLLTPANARRVAQQLAQMRGAAMKVGQLLSMDAGDLLPPELAEILARLRSDAKSMPRKQLLEVLETQWGRDWKNHFEYFNETPIAAASIGQVHMALTRDGRKLAIKIQYPGIRESIDSDVDNVAGLFRMSGLLPKSLDIEPLLADCKKQLHEEADYLREAESLERYAACLANHPDYLIPLPDRTLTTPNILAMTFVEGEAVESMAQASQTDRNRIGELLFQLLFKEIFEFQFIQTDPNFANYRYNSETAQLVLLDFGAARAYPDSLIQNYRTMLRHAMNQNRDGIDAAARSIGYYDDTTARRHIDIIVNIVLAACEPARSAIPYAFGGTEMAADIRDMGFDLGRERDFWHIPPVDAIFLHRKLAGLYLLCARLKAHADIRSLALRAVGDPPVGSAQSA
jgi:predicted unusual protein kinase regulating ubiquinone biosynthesis (AarF/ABC1/UbiB family)